ncbi:Lace1, partial [Symbiodinium necroappetens]
DLLAHSRYWHINLWNNLRSVPEENWMQQKEFWSQRHPYRPFPPQDQWSGEYVRASMYWSQSLEYLTWPFVQQFRGVPDLLHKAKSLDFAEISRHMSAWNQAAREKAKDFWISALPGLLTDEEGSALPQSVPSFEEDFRPGWDAGF